MLPSDVRFFDVENGMPPPWSPLSICLQYANIRGFTKGGGQVDYVQSGMLILRKNLECKATASRLCTVMLSKHPWYDVVQSCFSGGLMRCCDAMA